jgi:hypothetical protein
MNADFLNLWFLVLLSLHKSISKESPNLYRARALDNGSIAAEQSFELRTDELKVLEGMRRLEEKAVGALRKTEKETFHIEFGRELYNNCFHNA